MAFYNCTRLRRICSDTDGVAYFPNVTSITGDHSLNVGSSTIKYLYLPKITTQSGWSFRGRTLLVDWGPNITSINASYLTMNPVICRAKTPPSLSRNTSTHISSYAFVPADCVDTYKSTGNWATYFSSNIKAIGGDEWIATFGSADEYADYDLYGVPHS